MKKMLLASLLMSGLAISAHAQQGSTLVYGNIGFTTNKNGGAPLSAAPNSGGNGSFVFAPGIGYQFTNNWTLGVQGGYNYNDYSSYLLKSYSVGVFGRYTQPLSNIFSFYGQLNLSYIGDKQQAPGISNKYSGFYAGVTPNIAINVKNGFALNFGFGGLEYSSLKLSGGSNTGSSLGFTFGQQVNVGVSKNFGGGHKK